MADPPAAPLSHHLRVAWRAWRPHRAVLTLATLVLAGAWVLLESAVIRLHRLGPAWNVGLHAAFLLVFPGLLVGFHRMALDVVDGEHPDLGRLFSRLDRGPAALVAGVAWLLATAVGLVLLVAPGAWVGVRYALFGFVLAERRTSSTAALRDAALRVRGRWWPACALALAQAGLLLLGAAALGVGLLVAFPVATLAGASFHRARSAGRPEPAPPGPTAAGPA